MSAAGNDNSDNGAHPLRVAFGDFDHWENSIRKNLDPRYVPEFVNLSRARLRKFAAVIPLQLCHYPQLARRPELLRSKFICPSPAVVALCDDKLRLAEFLIAEGFQNVVPATRATGAPYPYVWKKRRSWWGLDCHIVKGPQDECGLNLSDGDYFAQDFVPGEVEFATHILRARGEIRYVSTFAHKMATPSFVNGAQDKPVQSTFFRGCHFLEIFTDILARLDFEGTACIDYKVTGGQPILFEINPRFGGSLCADVTAYLDAYVGSLTPQPPGHNFKSKLSQLRRRILARFG